MPHAPNTVRDLWRERVANQFQSGLSIANWCRQNNISPHTFYYWRDKFFPKTSISRIDFKEISVQQKEISQSQKSGVRLQYQEFCILLDLQFDMETFEQCIKALKGLQC